jgi:3-hydroxyisobutyrate dehydrogenase-like beta-hydroxyacid dehydrogenase
MDIGLIGIGTMGILAAGALVEAGHQVEVQDIDPQAVQRAVAIGAIATDSLRSMAQRAQVVFLLLPGPPQIESVVCGADGLLSEATLGQIIVDMSTVDPSTTRRMGDCAAEVGVDYLDAPILGRPSALGRWVLPVGGDEEVLARCRPLLEVLAHRIVHVGPLGSGHALKLLNALMFSAINAMTAEMMAISARVGLSPAVLFDTIASSNAATVSGLFKEVGAKIVERDFTPVFPIDLLCKDNGLAVAMAREFGTPPIVASLVQTLNELARARGLGAEDTSALVKVYEGFYGAEERLV